MLNDCPVSESEFDRKLEDFFNTITHMLTLTDDDATVVSLAHVGSQSISEGGSGVNGTVEFTVTLDRDLVSGEIIDVPLVFSGTNVTADDLDNLAIKTAGGSIEMDEAAAQLREKRRHAGRSIPNKAVGSTLLLKGLEADHVLLLDADNQGNSRMTKEHLYVALSRGRRCRGYPTGGGTPPLARCWYYQLHLALHVGVHDPVSD